MRGYWPQTSGLACDPRWARLSGCARGLLASLLDAADGPGEIDLHGMSALDVARAVLPHDDLTTVTAALAALQGARFVVVDEDVDALLVSLPRPNVATPARAELSAPTAETRGTDEREHSPQRTGQGARPGARDRRYLQALSSRFGLRTGAQRAEWAQGVGASKVAGVSPEDLDAWVCGAGRRGGRFGSERSSAHGDNTGDNTSAPRRQHGDNVVSVDGDNTGDNTLSPSHSPSERNTEIERENARGATETTPPPSRRQHGDNVVSVHGDNTILSRGDNTSDAERIEESLARRSSGRIDLLSAPASTRFALRTLLGEMGVDLPLAERMGELAANPAEVWPYLKDTSRVTLNFLVGKVDNNGVRAAGPLVELVSRARADLAAGTPAPTPEPPARPRPRAAPMSDADAAESLRIAQEFAARRRATPTQEPTHVP